ncbi:MAG TPA: amino acid permease, partial [Vicinamibacterales bacterium]|nr:amino acid permease [Vicinamibacterales bacterium]
GLAPQLLGKIHTRYQTPAAAIAAQALWASVLAATGAYRTLFTRVVYTEWLFFALLAAGLFVLRCRDDYRPAYRTWGYPAVPAVFIAASLAVVLHQFMADPFEAVFGLGIVAAGVPVYYFRHANRRLS